MTTDAELSPHDAALAIDYQSHRHRIVELELTVKLEERRRQQVWRLRLIILISVAWIVQTLFVTWSAVVNPLILDDVEKFLSLIAVTGAVVAVLVPRLWPQNGE
jgi:hypothetical protein